VSARYALLGLLVERPAYPYELADRLEKRLGPEWGINSGQVYQTIKNLEHAGLVEPVNGVDVREDRGFRAITERGVAEYESWLRREVPVGRLPRRPLIVKIALGGPERLQEKLRELSVYEQACADRLDGISRLLAAVPLESQLARPEDLALHLSLTADRFEVEAQLQWARHARERIWRLRDVDAPARPEESSEARTSLYGRMAARDRPLDASAGEG
jgi:DNA-binding PadR family transcriptional regulator